MAGLAAAGTYLLAGLESRDGSRDALIDQNTSPPGPLGSPWCRDNYLFAVSNSAAHPGVGEETSKIPCPIPRSLVVTVHPSRSRHHCYRSCRITRNSDRIEPVSHPTELLSLNIACTDVAVGSFLSFHCLLVFSSPRPTRF